MPSSEANWIHLRVARTATAKATSSSLSAIRAQSSTSEYRDSVKDRQQCIILIPRQRPRNRRWITQGHYKNMKGKAYFGAMGIGVFGGNVKSAYQWKEKKGK